MEIVAIGEAGFVTGFALGGVRKAVLATPENLLQEIEKHKEAIIILDESLIKDASIREQLETSISPVIITLAKDPSAKHERLRRTIINTLGVDLLQ